MKYRNIILRISIQNSWLLNYVTFTVYGEAKMISEKINEILNEQINKEFYSGYLYLSMSAQMKELGLNGFAEWMKHQAREEVEHGLKIFDYLIDCNSFVTLKQIKMPEFEFNGILSLFNIVYEHEKCITRAIMSLAKQAEEECFEADGNWLPICLPHGTGIQGR